MKKLFLSIFLFLMWCNISNIANANSENNNYIYYSDIKDDKYYKKIGFFKRGKGALKINLTNYSYIVKSANKDYEVEYVAAIESERKDAGFTVYSGNFTATNLKSGKSKNYKFSIREDSSSFEFLESSLLLELKFPRATWYRYTGMTCKNEQNPQCMKRLSEVGIIGFRDLKNNFSYKHFVNEYIKNVEEPKRVAEEKRKAEEKILKEEEEKIDKIYSDIQVEVKQQSTKSRLPLCEDDSSSHSTRGTIQKQSKKWLNCFGGLLFNLNDGGKLIYIGEFGPNIGLDGDRAAMSGAPGYFHGYGTYTLINANYQLEKYVGQFYKGAMNGQGTMYFKDGSRYEGMVSNKEFNGAGKLFSPDGSIEKEGLWENGKLVQSKKIEIVEDKQLKDCSAVEEILKKNISEKVKTLGGYRHIHFGMSRDDVLKIGDCSNSNINKIEGAFDSNNFGIDSFNSGIILSGLYKYSLGIMFKKNDTGPGSTVDKIELKVLTKIRQKEHYSFGSSGIKEFEKLKDLLSDKYKLITKPSDISIDKYNSNLVRGTLSWVFKSNYNDNLIILQLQGTRGMDGINYIYTGEVHYLSENQSKIYIEKIDSEKIKSDDL
ncbi:hypothetical protein OA527_03455 [Pelagibacteraceae bacterium]|nr:hypothetical protein [Pelagibacteraceae bacterium]